MLPLGRTARITHSLRGLRTAARTQESVGANGASMYVRDASNHAGNAGGAPAASKWGLLGAIAQQKLSGAIGRLRPAGNSPPFPQLPHVSEPVDVLVRKDMEAVEKLAANHHGIATMHTTDGPLGTSICTAEAFQATMATLDARTNTAGVEALLHGVSTSPMANFPTLWATRSERRRRTHKAVFTQTTGKGLSTHLDAIPDALRPTLDGLTDELVDLPSLVRRLVLLAISAKPQVGAFLDPDDPEIQFAAQMTGDYGVGHKKNADVERRLEQLVMRLLEDNIAQMTKPGSFFHDACVADSIAIPTSFQDVAAMPAAQRSRVIFAYLALVFGASVHSTNITAGTALCHPGTPNLLRLLAQFDPSEFNAENLSTGRLQILRNSVLRAVIAGPAFCRKRVLLGRPLKVSLGTQWVTLPAGSMLVVNLEAITRDLASAWASPTHQNWQLPTPSLIRNAELHAAFGGLPGQRPPQVCPGRFAGIAVTARIIFELAQSLGRRGRHWQLAPGAGLYDRPDQVYSQPLRPAGRVACPLQNPKRP